MLGKESNYMKLFCSDVLTDNNSNTFNSCFNLIITGKRPQLTAFFHHETTILFFEPNQDDVTASCQTPKELPRYYTLQE